MWFHEHPHVPELCHGSQGKGWPQGRWCPLVWETSTLCIHLLMDFFFLFHPPEQARADYICNEKAIVVV